MQWLNSGDNMKLIKYIKEHHNGNVSAFAVANNMKRQQVAECVSKGYYHVIEIEGELMLVLAKRKIKEKTNDQAK